MHDFIFMGIAVFLLFIILVFVGLAMYAAYYMYTSRKKILATAGKVIKKAGEYVNKKVL